MKSQMMMMEIRFIFFHQATCLHWMPSQVSNRALKVTILSLSSQMKMRDNNTICSLLTIVPHEHPKVTLH